jgi:hypothetical protein
VLPGEYKYWGQCVNEISGRRYDFTSAQLSCLTFTVVNERVWSDEKRDHFDAEWPRMSEMIKALFDAYEDTAGVKFVAR